MLESIGAEGQPTRRYYQRRLPGDSSRDYYFIHRLTGNTQPLLVEYGFIDTPSDLARLQNNILDYAEAVVRAVANYAGVTYVPPGGSSGSTSNTYVVSKGDSLWKIANQFNVTVDELKQANNLTSNLLDIGQILTIPTKQSTTVPSVPNGTGTIYTVQVGDTLFMGNNE